MTHNKSQPDTHPSKCYHCDKPPLLRYGRTPLCVDCYYKLTYADFMQAQIMHNRQSWLATHYNLVQQDLCFATGGLIPLKAMTIPDPLTAPNYSSQHIELSETNIGVLNTGTIQNLNAGMQVIHDLGDTHSATAIKQLTQAILDNKEIQDQQRRELAENLEFLVTEALAQKDMQRKCLAKRVMTDLTQSISGFAGLLTIWNNLQPLLQAYLGLQ